MSRRTYLGRGIRVLKYMIGGYIGYNIYRSYVPYLPPQFVLHVDLQGPISDTRTTRTVQSLMQGEDATTDLASIVLALEKAKDDPRVIGVVGHFKNNVSMSLAQAQEIKAALQRFRKTSNKFTSIYSEQLHAQDTPVYIAALGFDDINIQPTSGVGLSGLSSDRIFLKALLSKIGIEVQHEARYQYKTALEPFTEEHMTEPSREQTNRVLDSVHSQILKAIANARNMSVADARAIFGKGPFFANEALKLGLVDAVRHRDEFTHHLVHNVLKQEPHKPILAIEPSGTKWYTGDSKEYEQVFEKAVLPNQLVPCDKYLAATRPWPFGDKRERIVMIFESGTIESGSISTRVSGITADLAVAKLRLARMLPGVKAVVYRIDSPGGDVTASDIIAREVKNVRNSGIPVVVSMGSTAASGGYYMAMNANHIVALPATITGSIGVFGMKPYIRPALENNDLHVDGISRGENAGLYSLLHPWDGARRATIAKVIDQMYDNFTRQVSWARQLTKDQVDQVARGRVWTGEDALKHKLVDSIGGLMDAVAIAKKLAQLAPDADVRLQEISSLQVLWGMQTGALPSERSTDNTISRSLSRQILSQFLIPSSILNLLRLSDAIAENPELLAIERTLAQNRFSVRAEYSADDATRTP